MRSSTAAVLTGLLALLSPVFAHHSFQAQYDPKQEVTITGTIAKVHWQNPHVHVDLEVKTDQPGVMTTWELELDSPNMLLSQGWKFDSLKPGQQITVKGARARNGSNALRAQTVTLDAP